MAASGSSSDTLTNADGANGPNRGKGAAGAFRWRNVRSRRLWLLIASVAFLLSLGATHGDVWRAGAREVVPTGRILGSDPDALPIEPLEVLRKQKVLSAVHRADALFEAWLVARNAATLLRHPLHLFDTEHCAPAEKTLTLGVPMIAMGVLGIPFAFVTGDPIITYNSAIAIMTLLMAFAMYWLVADWTGVPAAGIVAGLLYAFHPLRLYHIVHPAEWDTSWTVFALLFAHRLFALGRWRDAAGLAFAIAFQAGASFYQFVAATFLTPLFAGWLVLRYRFSPVRLVQIATVVISAALAGVLIYGPYLEARADSSEILRRNFFFYVGWMDYLPNGRAFLGWPLVVLASIGIAARRRLVLAKPDADPRWALLAGAVLVAFVAAGDLNSQILRLLWSDPPFAIPDPYAYLAGLLPGLNAVRVVFRLSAAVLLTAAVISGFGAAALIKAAPRYSGAIAVGLIAVSSAAVVRPELFGPSQPRGWDLHSVRVDAEAVKFFETLESGGNHGPLLELPYFAGFGIGSNPERILLTAYHRRRTSACYGSFLPPETREIATLSATLPNPTAIRRLRELGFTTVILHDPRVAHPILRGIVGDSRVAKQLRLLGSSRSMVALELLDTDRDEASETTDSP